MNSINSVRKSENQKSECPKSDAPKVRVQISYLGARTFTQCILYLDLRGKFLFAA